MPLAVLAAGVLWGTVTIGPLTPVCRVGTTCDGPAKHATLTFFRAGQKIATRTDAMGHYRVTLRMGSWAMRASVGMRATPSTFLVRAGAHRQNFSIDTGIR